MNNHDYILIKEHIAILHGLPLRSVTRVADMLCLGFGELFEQEIFWKVKDKQKAPKTRLVSEYGIHFQCLYRIVGGNEIILAKNDRYQPSSIISPDNYDDFEYDKVGNNLLDENIATKFIDLADFIVKDIKLNRLGDLLITFTNGFLVEGLADLSKSEECWRFFKTGNIHEPHLVVAHNGLLEG